MMAKYTRATTCEEGEERGGTRKKRILGKKEETKYMHYRA
jgi:hypothetical protein